MLHLKHKKGRINLSLLDYLRLQERLNYIVYELNANTANKHPEGRITVKVSV